MLRYVRHRHKLFTEDHRHEVRQRCARPPRRGKKVSSDQARAHYNGLRNVWLIGQATGSLGLLHENGDYSGMASGVLPVDSRPEKEGGRMTAIAIIVLIILFFAYQWFMAERTRRKQTKKGGDRKISRSGSCDRSHMCPFTSKPEVFGGHRK